MRLSEKQTTVLQKLASGMTTKVIADHLSMAPKTVEVHIREVKKRLGAKTLAHAVALGYEKGYIK